MLKDHRLDYNRRRPHSSLGHLTPAEFAAARIGLVVASLPPANFATPRSPHSHNPWTKIRGHVIDLHAMNDGRGIVPNPQANSWSFSTVITEISALLKDGQVMTWG